MRFVQIPMSNGLSATCATAMGLAPGYGGRVHVVDNQNFRNSASICGGRDCSSGYG